MRSHSTVRVQWSLLLLRSRSLAPSRGDPGGEAPAVGLRVLRDEAETGGVLRRWSGRGPPKHRGIPKI